MNGPLDKVVFATRNRHKVDQVRAILGDLKLVTVDEVVPGIELSEPFDTFVDNALAKARAVADATGLPAIADDSGIEVDVLDGRPGVLSARFAGPDASDAENNTKLIAHLEGIADDRLTCRYRCAAVLVLPQGTELIAEGTCEGVIVREGRGELGFGYDPHVVPEGDTRTMGEIPLEEKLAFSHRGRAFRALAEQMASIR